MRDAIDAQEFAVGCCPRRRLLRRGGSTGTHIQVLLGQVASAAQKTATIMPSCWDASYGV